MDQNIQSERFMGVILFLPFLSKFKIFQIKDYVYAHICTPIKFANSS